MAIVYLLDCFLSKCYIQALSRVNSLLSVGPLSHCLPEGRGPSAPFLSSLCSYTVGEVAEDRNLALSGHQYLLQLQSSEISNTWLLVLGGRQSDLCCVWVSF